MVDYRYRGPKFDPLNSEEIEEKLAGAKEEMEEVLEWKKEEEDKLADENSSPQKKAAAKRALKKVHRRINTVKGNILYWELRVEGKSHFKANLERHELWDKLKNSPEGICAGE